MRPTASPSTRSRPVSGSLRLRRLAIAALAAALTAATVATAQAQEDPNATVEEQATTYDLDTDLTPVAKETDLWTLVHGAEYPDTEVRADSLTSFSTDLFDVSFRNRTIGLAGGSRCALEPVREKTESSEAFGARVGACKGTDESTVPRVPALYRYAEPQNEDPRWERLTLPNEEDQAPGYVGAIAWIDAQRALIVGGTGTYPRREGAPDAAASTDPAKPDQAGTARAWVYRRASATAPEAIEEIDLSAHTQTTTVDAKSRAGMRAFTALDCYRDPNPQPGEAKIELCLAGALGQIWEWRGGSFSGKRIDALSGPTELTDARLFRYRVRDLAFAAAEPPEALAATAGCCDPDPAKNTPRILRYAETASPRWRAEDYVPRASVPDIPACTPKIGSVQPVCLPPEQAAEAGRQANEADNSRRETNDTPAWPDSIYSIMASSGSSPSASAILSPGDPDPTGDRPSVITTSTISPVKSETETLRAASFSTARLLDGGGSSTDIDPNRPGTHCPPSVCFSGTEPDWAVGELRSSARGGLGAQGLVVATGLAPTAEESVNVEASIVGGRGVNCGSPCSGSDVRRPTSEDAVSGWQPVDQEKLDNHIRSQHYLLPSYTANAIEIVGAEEDGWMVGDHGAILRISTNALGAAQGASEPKPPKLGAPRPRSLSERDAYEPAQPPLPAGAGTVPALGAETIALGEPRMIPMGSAPSGQIVISRDGSEGWAAGSGGVSHFDGIAWRRCYPDGVAGVVDADPACGALPASGALGQMARVPLENDSDPTNDDELEIVALGGYRYRDGRWRVDAAVAAPPGAFNNNFTPALAFAAPDEGWLVRSASRILNPASPSVQVLLFWRFDGTRWIDCEADPEPCGDEEGRLAGLGPRNFGGIAAVGKRVYLYGSRTGPGDNLYSTYGLASMSPLIVYRDPGGSWTDGSGPGEDGAGLDPVFEDPATEQLGRVESLALAEGPRGPEGWAVGSFSAGRDGAELDWGASTSVRAGTPAALLRLDPSAGKGWRPYQSPGAFEDHMVSAGVRAHQDTPPPRSSPALQVAYPSQLDPDSTFIGQISTASSGGRVFGFDAERGRFELLESARPQATRSLEAAGTEEPRPAGALQAMAPDGRGGFWASASNYFFHYTREAPEPVFTESPSPLGARGVGVKDLAAGPDGSVWVATDSDRLYRYERGLGWEEARVPGWDPGRVVTRTSQANAIAIGESGVGLVVGEGGRIAELSGTEVVLDRAAGRSCGLGDETPCGTSRDLGAVAVAPDGAALVGGERLSLLWRPPGGELRAGEKPPIASSTEIEAISYPTATTAYLATDAGVVFRGSLAGGRWSWRAENLDEDGEPRSTEPLRDIAVDASGHGYAVGDQGLVLERTEAGWRGLASRSGGDLTTVELARGGGAGVLIGGQDGLILTGEGPELEVARPADFRGNLAPQSGPVVGLAYLPGSTPGSVDAWAAIASASSISEGDDRLLRHRSDPDDPLLDSAAASEALPDTPEEQAGELSLAVFGKSDCELAEADLCPPMSATTSTNEVISRRIVAELAERRGRGELDLAVLTGDAVDSAGQSASSLGDFDRFSTGLSQVQAPGLSRVQNTGQLKHRRFGELVVEELEEKGVPLLGAIGGQDLSESHVCDTESCETTKRFANAGESYAWREAFAARAEPWGDGSQSLGAETEGEITFEPATGSEDNSLALQSQGSDADAAGPAPEAKAAIGGAATHYAIDALKDGEEIARIVFVDTSLRSLQAGEPLQQPHELGGGQQRFLERMICKEGGQSTFGDGCTRGKDQRAIVVSNTPTYSYGPGALTHTALDGTTFEATMLRYDVDLVISGALGYNGLYYTLAPGVHEPCPAGEYPEAPPTGNTPDCLAGPTGPADAVAKQAPADPASLVSGQGLSGAYPTLIASGGGGKLGPDGTEPPDGPAGQWHGYSLARLLASGELAIEQRPILDWIGLDAPEHAVGPRARLRLNGYGRSPISTTTVDEQVRAFHYEISTPAITHRYDLLLADPDEPWLPCTEDDINCQELHANLTNPNADEEPTPTPAGKDNPCSPYLCLPARIGVVDDQSGQVRAGDGRYPETFAIAMLSVDEEVATYPLVFKRSPAFVTSPSVRTGTLPKLSGARPGAPPPPPPPPGLPQIPQVDVPQIPPPPGIPQLTAATPPELQPPAPPAPPPPSQQPAALDLTVAPPGISISTPTALIQPPTPPVNPAPPGGARREARQRQAAAQKGGADSSDAQEQNVDMADGPIQPEGSAMTRHQPAEATRRDRVKPGQSFTSLARAESRTGSPATLYVGGLTLAALTLALGFSTLRPGPRRRPPVVPAPSFTAVRRRR